MNQFKRWSIIVLAVILAPMGFVAVANLIIDPHGVFHFDPARISLAPNLGYLKVNRLLRDKERFDSFLLGSSRVANIDVRNIPGGHWYNMFLAAALPQEDLQHLRFLLENGVRVKNVMVGLDDFSFLFDPADHLAELDIQPHPGVSGKRLQAFYFEYLFKARRLFPNIKTYISRNSGARQLPGESRYRFDIVDTGMVLCRDCDEDIERNREGHARSALFLKPWDYRFMEGDYMASSLDALKEIAALARKNNIRLVIFINPIHQATYAGSSNLKKFARFKKELALITDYYDFSGINSVTTNNYYYYETSHYRLLVGDMMLKVMLGAPDVSVPRDFGEYITRSNIEAHLADQCRQLQALTGPPELSPKNRLFAEACNAALR